MSRRRISRNGAQQGDSIENGPPSAQGPGPAAGQRPRSLAALSGRGTLNGKEPQYTAVEGKRAADSEDGRCPRCGSGDTARILYGYMQVDERLERDLDARRVTLGGCCVSDDDPDMSCNSCDAIWSHNPDSVWNKTLKLQESDPRKP